MTDPSVNLQKSFSLVVFLTLLALFGVMIAGFFGALVFAAASALMFYPFQLWLERYLNCRLAAVINVIIWLALIIVPAVFLLGLATTQAVGVAEQASGWFSEHINEDVSLPEWFPYAGELSDLRDEVTSKAGQVAGAVGRFLIGTLSQVTQATGLFLLDLFVAAFFFYYCLLHGNKLTDAIVMSMPLSAQSRADLVRISSGVTSSVLKSILVIGIVQAALSGFAFWFVGIRSFVFWGVIMGFLSVIPFIGPIIIWLPVAVFLAVTGDYWSAIMLAVWFWVVVASVDNVLRPILVGADTQMPEILVLLTTLGGLFVFGAIGLLVGPLVGALLMASWAVYREAFADELAGTVPAGEHIREAPADAGRE